MSNLRQFYSTGSFPYDSTPVVKATFSLDYAAFCAAYPNVATLLNAPNYPFLLLTASYSQIGGLTRNIAIRSLAIGGIALNVQYQYDGNPSDYYAGATLTGASPVFKASTEPNIPITKTFASIGSFPGSPSAPYVQSSAQWYCANTAKYYVFLTFWDQSTTAVCGYWFFSIDPATGTTVLLINRSTVTGGPMSFGDGTNFCINSLAYDALTIPYYTVSSGNFVATGLQALGAKSTVPANFPPGFLGNTIICMGTTRFWMAGITYEAGGSYSLNLTGTPKLTNIQKVTSYKLVSGTGAQPLIPIITGSATAGAQDLLYFDNNQNISYWPGLMI